MVQDYKEKRNQKECKKHIRENKGTKLVKHKDSMRKKSECKILQKCSKNKKKEEEEKQHYKRKKFSGVKITLILRKDEDTQDRRAKTAKSQNNKKFRSTIKERLKKYLKKQMLKREI